jgi:hypothetical protein
MGGAQGVRQVRCLRSDVYATALGRQCLFAHLAMRMDDGCSGFEVVRRESLPRPAKVRWVYYIYYICRIRARAGYPGWHDWDHIITPSIKQRRGRER